MNDFSRMFTKMVPSIREDELELAKQQKLTGIKTVIRGERTVPVNIHRAKKDFAPVLFELHGGGFVFGNELKNDEIGELIRQRLDINVVSIGYSKAPENPYPAALDDIYFVMKWFYDNNLKEKVDKDLFAVMGFSAGANLATVTAMMAKQRNDFNIFAQVLHYPYLDALTHPSDKKRHPGDIPLEMMELFADYYSSGNQREFYSVSPIKAEKSQLEGLAPALIITAQEDALKDEGEKYYEMLKKAGVETEYKAMPGAHHGYIEDWYNPAIYAASPEDKKNVHSNNFGDSAEKAIEIAIEFLNKRIGYNSEL